MISDLPLKTACRTTIGGTVTSGMDFHNREISGNYGDSITPLQSANHLLTLFPDKLIKLACNRLKMGGVENYARKIS